MILKNLQSDVVKAIQEKVLVNQSQYILIVYDRLLLLWLSVFLLINHSFHKGLELLHSIVNLLDINLEHLA